MAQSGGTRALGLAYGLACGGVFSFGGLATRYLESANAWQAVSYRSGFLAAAMLLLCLVRYRGGTARAFLSMGRAGVAACFVLGLANSAYVIGFLETAVANAQFLLSTGPVLAALLGTLFLGERLRAFAWAAIAGTALGVLVMVYDGLTAGGLAGNLVALFAALSFAVYTVMLRRSRGADAMPVLVLASVFSAGLGALGAGGDLAISNRDLLVLALMGAVQSVIGFLLMARAARHIAAGEVSLLAMAEAVLGPLWVWLLIGETPTHLALAGGAVVLVSVFGFAVAAARAERAQGPGA